MFFLFDYGIHALYITHCRLIEIHRPPLLYMWSLDQSRGAGYQTYHSAQSDSVGDSHPTVWLHHCCKYQENFESHAKKLWDFSSICIHYNFLSTQITVKQEDIWWKLDPSISILRSLPCVAIYHTCMSVQLEGPDFNQTELDKNCTNPWILMQLKKIVILFFWNPFNQRDYINIIPCYKPIYMYLVCVSFALTTITKMFIFKITFLQCTNESSNSWGIIYQ